MEYRVRWEADIEADSALDAAKKAMKRQRDDDYTHEFEVKAYPYGPVTSFIKSDDWREEYHGA